MYTHTPHCTLNFPARNPGVSSPLSKSHCGARIGCTPCPQTHLRFLVTKKRRNAFKFFCGEKKPWVKISKTTFFFPGIAWHRVTEGYVCRLVSFFVKDKDVCLELYFPSEKTMNYKVKSSFAPWQTNAYTSTQTLSKQKLRIQLLCTTWILVKCLHMSRDWNICPCFCVGLTWFPTSNWKFHLGLLFCAVKGKVCLS